MSLNHQQLYIEAPVNQVLFANDLLYLIFKNLSRKDNTVNARVCKTWSEEALNLVWRKAQFFGLVQLLGPYRYDSREGGRRWTLLEIPRPNDWARFWFYSSRVHELEDFGILSPRVFRYINMTRPPAELLPNMHTLKYSYQQTEFLPLLLGARLKSLDLSSRSRDDMILPSVLRYVGSRSPHLTHLSLPVMSFSLDLERALIEVVTSLTQLTDFSAPNTLLTPSVVSVLSILPCLQSLRGNERPYSPMGLEAGAHPPMNDNCSTFPSLCTLVLRIPFSRFVYWLSAYPMPTLTELHIGPIVVESADDHSRLLKAVMEGCPKLRCFFLLPLSHAVTDIRDAEPLHFDHLQWLVQGSSLLDLDISHTLPLELTPSDLVTLLKALLSIERLHLNSYPGNCLDGSEELSLDVNVLATIIPYASRVRDLGLCMSSKGLPLPDDTRLEGTLGQLRTLTIGRSPCQSAPEVAAFLSMVLPINCSIGDDEDLSEGWSEVVEYIPVFRRVRIEERLRASRSSSVD